MGVDHGLGGRDNKKSRQRREKKAKRVKAIAIKALHSGTKKKEVVFDEAARTEWLTGFHKRKQERRKFGLAMQIIKDKKQHKDAIREQRSTLQAASQYDRNNNNKPKKDEDDEEDEEDKEGEEDGFDYDYMGEDPPTSTAVVVAGKTVFTDERTQSMFGGAVTVVVDTGVADELFEQNNPDLPEQGMGLINHKLAREKKVLNKLEKAMKQVDRLGKMNKKKKKSSSALEEGGVGGGGKGGFNKKQKQNGKLLYHKALGSGALPGRTYKGNKKGKRAG